MSNEEPKVMPASRYAIRQTSELLGISRNTLRKYTDKGFIKCGYHQCTMKKYYTGSEILRFWKRTF